MGQSYIFKKNYILSVVLKEYFPLVRRNALSRGYGLLGMFPILLRQRVDSELLFFWSRDYHVSEGMGMLYW